MSKKAAKKAKSSKPAKSTKAQKAAKPAARVKKVVYLSAASDKTDGLSPQASIIVQTLHAAGRITRKELIAKLKSALTTNQEPSRVLSHYKKSLVASGAIKIEKVEVAPPAKKAKKTEEAPAPAAEASQEPEAEAETPAAAHEPATAPSAPANT